MNNTNSAPTLDRIALDYLKASPLDKIRIQCFIQGILAARGEAPSKGEPPEKKPA